jgi:hypothetical protein
MIDGQSGESIAAAIKELWPKQNPDRILQTAAEHFTRLAHSAPDALLGWCLAATRDLYRKLVEVGDYAGALKAIKLLHDLAQDRPTPTPGLSINLPLIELP